MKQKTQDKMARIDTIKIEMDEIPAILDGTLMRKHNRVKRKNGSIHISPEYYTFQFLGADGKRKWKRIPRKAKAGVERLVRAAKRYRKLEREYLALLTEVSLEGSIKKND